MKTKVFLLTAVCAVCFAWSLILVGCKTAKPEIARTTEPRVVSAPEAPAPPLPPGAIVKLQQLRSVSPPHQVQQPFPIGPPTPRDELYPVRIWTNAAGNWVHEFAVDKDWSAGYVVQKIPIQWQPVNVVYGSRSNVIVTTGPNRDSAFRLLRITN